MHFLKIMFQRYITNQHSFGPHVFQNYGIWFEHVDSLFMFKFNSKIFVAKSTSLSTVASSEQPRKASLQLSKSFLSVKKGFRSISFIFFYQLAKISVVTLVV